MADAKDGFRASHRADREEGGAVHPEGTRAGDPPDEESPLAKVGEEEIERNLVTSRRILWVRRAKIRRVFSAASHRGSVLEVGCGDGLNLGILRDLGYGPVFGMDTSAFLLGRVRDRVDGVFLGDACLLPVRSGSVDNVFVDSVLHHVRAEALVDEAARILRPGGFFAFCEPSGGSTWTWLNLAGRYVLRHVSGLFRQRDENLRLERELHEAWFSLIPEMRRILAERGLRIRRWRKGPLNVSCLAEKLAAPLDRFRLADDATRGPGGFSAGRGSSR